ncbi:MBL fold metallo-hydrolase [Candidatus Hydrogenosomobacter endosymbioticus]|uniref:Metal-dependent hydrolase n=1 Tax=Candidatus Hydrogenosomobacter endosymbioticus TaxID=2558174 RepID=A0ABM7V9G5_9PROT|nr:MBL fold metallo-hydrolase [Candidatus Hydrogenosomobacter endosymbioticus]BDB96144.1 metal-dependent hydrolase [Candidatus Hydrogenosomobacter endosymbioticus]
MKIIFLGCGASVGVPIITGDWGSCSVNNPKNIRTRSSVAVEINGKLLLIDMSADIRHQLLREKIRFIDSALCTHSHFDHAAGINELKPFFVKYGKKIPVYGHKTTMDELCSCYSHVFTRSGTPCCEDITFLPFLTRHDVDGEFEVFGEQIISFQQSHGLEFSTGFRFSSWAYSTDVSALDEHVFSLLKNLDLWIVSCLSQRWKAKHAPLEEVLEWIKRVNPKRAIITHMSADLDYNTLRQTLPHSIEPAYDGMVIEVT